MNVDIIFEFELAIIAALIIMVYLIYYFLNKKVNQNINEYKSITEAITSEKEKLINKKNELSAVIEKLERDQETLKRIDVEVDEGEKELTEIDIDISESNKELALIKEETRNLQLLKSNADQVAMETIENREEKNRLIDDCIAFSRDLRFKEDQMEELIGKIDLYNRMDDLIVKGFFEEPEYLYNTSLRYTEEIKRVRDQQKILLQNKEAVEYPSDIILKNDKANNKRVLEGQVKLMLNAFNIECDILIGKVGPSNFARTLERIEKLANGLEKNAATLHCGFNIDYIELKYSECRLQYQNSLKKEEEQNEQRLIREQIKDEQRAIKEYEKAIVQAEREEKLYRNLLEQAREQLSKASDEDRLIAQQRIADLEEQLENAQAKEERAKSMAQQTRKGHVYVISNVGSFGENIYKIGLTRRLEPMDRVSELSGASVPFPFDVHAMIYVDDAPALETALHRAFTTSRVNTVNMRKEFFNVDLLSIKKAVERIAGVDAEFKMTAIAKDYYASRRLSNKSIKSQYKNGKGRPEIHVSLTG